MPSPRIRRLGLDYELLTRVLRDMTVVQMTGTAGLPPEIYRFTYSLRGLYVSPTGDILERTTHVLEVNLSLDYPRRAPQCRMLTPVFHPNFDDASVCIGDFWAASEGLDDLVFRIGRMIAYQEYNTKSPLNGLAAKWAAEHKHLLPIDNSSIGATLDKTTTESIVSNQNGRAKLPPSQVPSPRTEIDDPWATKITIR
jgi:ubiquitin-protein ligase